MPILYTVKTTVIAFLGFEMAFLFYPYLQNKKAAAKGIVIANTLTLVVYLHITFICFIYFSPEEITQFLWPTLTLVKPIQFPFLERMEIVFVSFYIFLFSTSGIPYLFFVLSCVIKRTGSCRTFCFHFLQLSPSSSDRPIRSLNYGKSGGGG